MVTSKEFWQEAERAFLADEQIDWLGKAKGAGLCILLNCVAWKFIDPADTDKFASYSRLVRIEENRLSRHKPPASEGAYWWPFDATGESERLRVIRALQQED